jgi:hypothetical protein
MPFSLGFFGAVRILPGVLGSIALTITTNQNAGFFFVMVADVP